MSQFSATAMTGVKQSRPLMDVPDQWQSPQLTAILRRLFLVLRWTLGQASRFGSRVKHDDRSDSNNPSRKWSDDSDRTHAGTSFRQSGDLGAAGGAGWVARPEWHLSFYSACTVSKAETTACPPNL